MVHQLNSDEIKKQRHDYYILNRESILENKRKYYKRTRDDRLEYRRKHSEIDKINNHNYHIDKKESIAERKRKWHLDNHAQRIEYSRKYRLEHPITEEQRLAHCESARKWLAEHPIEARLHMQARRSKTRGIKIVKEEIHNWESRICGICNQPIDGDFHIDHIIPLSKNGPHHVNNLQLAHPKCNLSKNNKLTLDRVIVCTN